MTEPVRSYPRPADMVSVWVAVEQNATVHWGCALKHGIATTLEFLQPFEYKCYICGRKIGPADALKGNKL